MTHTWRPVFPFTALVGQERMKRALLLNAVNPRIGGVLIRGEKGTAKSTAVRALANLLPDIEVIAGCPYSCDPAAPHSWCDRCRDLAAHTPGPLPVERRRVPLVELPIGATEDRVVGTLDLERAIKEGERHFEPGLLAAANRGILYIDEVNLLSDHLVDVILDAAAMGTNYVEREGVSVQHPAQFILVGTMNPEEGDLRPQLLDRFALAVEVESLRAPADRAEVVRRRVAFEADPQGFLAAWEAAEAAERARILAARALLPRVRLDERMLGLIAQLCCDFAVDGLRADIVMYKTALTLAAYAGREAVTEAEVREAAELALLHRRRRQPFQEPGLDREQLEARIRDYLDRESPPSSSATERQEPGTASPTSSPAGSPADAAGSADTAPEQVFPPGPPPPAPSLAASARPRLTAVTHGRRSKAVVRPEPGAPARGAYVRSVPLRDGTLGNLALDATLRAAAPYQLWRRQQQPGGPAVRLARPDLRQKVRETRTGNLILFVVDASGSMAAHDRMRAAKGAVLSLLLDAYRKRDQVGLIAFRGRRAAVLLPPTTSVELAERRLRELPTGGRTPLAHALHLAWQTVERQRLSQPGLLPLLVLVSDGRANVPLAVSTASPGTPAGCDGDLLAELRWLAALLQRHGTTSIVVDSETGPARLGLAREVAAALGARYLALDGLSTERLVRAVREARA
jgi:magnesium chelatase subunit D